MTHRDGGLNNVAQQLTF